MQNYYWAKTGMMDDFGDIIYRDMDGLLLMACSLTYFT